MLMRPIVVGCRRPSNQAPQAIPMLSFIPKGSPSPTLHIPIDTGVTVPIAETIAMGRSERGGWSKAQFAMIGIAWPPVKGWRATYDASDIHVPKDLHDRFVVLRGKSKRARRA